MSADESLDEEDYEVLMQCIANSYEYIRENAWGPPDGDYYLSKLYKNEELSENEKFVV